jgi:hypothetical protein
VGRMSHDNLHTVGAGSALMETGSATGLYGGQAYVDRVEDRPVDRIGFGTSGLAGLTHNRRYPDPSEGRTEIRCHVPVAGRVEDETRDTTARLHGGYVLIHDQRCGQMSSE